MSWHGKFLYYLNQNMLRVMRPQDLIKGTVSPTLTQVDTTATADLTAVPIYTPKGPRVRVKKVLRPKKPANRSKS